MMDSMKEKVLMQLLNSDAAKGLTSIIAEVENELLEAAEPVDESLGTGHIDRIPAVEDRQAAIQQILQAIATDSVGDLWTNEMLPELVENPNVAETYVGMGSDSTEWEAKLSTWAENYRENGATGPDRTLAAHHVESMFGVDLELFEDRVVDFSGSEQAARLFAANFWAVRDVLQDAAGEVGGDD